MSEILDRLKDWGCDVAGAMERVVGDEELYIKCLEIFVTDENFEALGLALEQKDYKTAFEHAHALKGVAANLGLTPLLNAVAELVSSLRAGCMDGLETQYRTVLAALAVLKSCVGKDDEPSQLS